MPKKSNLDYKDQALYAALGLIAVGLLQVNKSLKAHVQACEEGSKNVRRVLWLVFGAVATELVVKGLSVVHLG